MRIIKSLIEWFRDYLDDEPHPDPETEEDTEEKDTKKAKEAGKPQQTQRPEKSGKQKPFPGRPLSFYEEKAQVFHQINEKTAPWLRNSARCRWYKKHLPVLYQRRQLLHFIRILSRPKLPLWPDFFRWLFIDFLRGRNRRFWGIYQFVALPGEGKTMSMVAHMERARARTPEIYIATNFGYTHQNLYISHWTDIVKAAMHAKNHGLPCIIAVDEIHVLFDSADWRSFPAELLALLSFNRKFSLQFLCSSQIYERIPKKVRDIANYTVICKNIWSSDRLFRNYYFTKSDYESSFDGKRVSAQFVREFVASDSFYSLYDTLEQISRMTEDAIRDRSRKQEAFELLFGTSEEPGEAAQKQRAAPPR